MGIQGASPGTRVVSGNTTCIQAGLINCLSCTKALNQEPYSKDPIKISPFQTLSLSQHTQRNWLPGCVLPFSHVQGASDLGKDLCKMPSLLQSPKQDLNKTPVMPGMSFPAVNCGVELCFQSQHYKWALLTDQKSLKSVSQQRRWCSVSR